jgi:hypothetical protein
MRPVPARCMHRAAGARMRAPEHHYMATVSVPSSSEMATSSE